MQTVLRLKTTVLPGNRLEMTAPELPEGAKVDVTVVFAGEQKLQFVSALDFLESLPPAPSPRCFPTWDEYERHLQAEKDAWER
jgi:hypothetical protein